jgi:hypothetical protein
MIRLRVTPDPARPEGGYALIRISGLAAPPADARFAIEREGWERGVLGPDGWQVGAALLSPLAVRQDGAEVVLAVGPEVVDRVETGPVRFRLPAVGIDQPLFWPDLPTSHAGSRGPVPLAPPRRPAVAPPPATPSPTVAPTAPLPPPMVEPLAPRPAAPPPPARRSLPLLAGVLVVLALGAGAGVWWAARVGPDRPAEAPAAAPPAVSPPPPASAAAPPPAPLPPPADPSLADLSVPEVIARAPGVPEIAAEAAARAARGRHEDALLLWEAAARLGHAPALTALARLYDPVGFQPGRPFRHPDPRQAARYYREAVRAGDAGAEAPRAALRAWLEEQARRGDSLAPLTLQDFWP